VREPIFDQECIAEISNWADEVGSKGLMFRFVDN